MALGYLIVCVSLAVPGPSNHYSDADMNWPGFSFQTVQEWGENLQDTVNSTPGVRSYLGEDGNHEWKVGKQCVIRTSDEYGDIMIGKPIVGRLCRITGSSPNQVVSVTQQKYWWRLVGFAQQYSEMPGAWDLQVFSNGQWLGGRPWSNQPIVIDGAVYGIHMISSYTSYLPRRNLEVDIGQSQITANVDSGDVQAGVEGAAPAIGAEQLKALNKLWGVSEDHEGSAVRDTLGLDEGEDLGDMLKRNLRDVYGLDVEAVMCNPDGSVKVNIGDNMEANLNDLVGQGAAQELMDQARNQLLGGVQQNQQAQIAGQNDLKDIAMDIRDNAYSVGMVAQAQLDAANAANVMAYDNDRKAELRSQNVVAGLGSVTQAVHANASNVGAAVTASGEMVAGEVGEAADTIAGAVTGSAMGQGEATRGAIGQAAADIGSGLGSVEGAIRDVGEDVRQNMDELFGQMSSDPPSPTAQESIETIVFEEAGNSVAGVEGGALGGVGLLQPGVLVAADWVFRLNMPAPFLAGGVLAIEVPLLPDVSTPDGAALAQLVFVGRSLILMIAAIIFICKGYALIFGGIGQ